MVFLNKKSDSGRQAHCTFYELSDTSSNILNPLAVEWVQQWGLEVPMAWLHVKKHLLYFRYISSVCNKNTLFCDAANRKKGQCLMVFQV